MRDYGDMLAVELQRLNIATGELWIENDGTHLRAAMGAGFRLLRRALTLHHPTAVVWHYSPFAYAYRGIPLVGVLFGLVLRARGIPVVTVLHELFYPWGHRGLVGTTYALTQRVALRAVLAGSTSVIVTTEQRAAAVRRRRWGPPRASVDVVPVFSTIGEGMRRPAAEPQVLRLGVIGYGSDGAQVDLFFDALRQIPGHRTLRVVLLGAPGPASVQGRRWMRLAEVAGVGDQIEFTGVVSAPSLGAHFVACAVVVLLDKEGPTSRRTMLAAALAHGCPTVATDGPNRWDDPVDKGAVLLVPPCATALGQVLQRLLEHAPERDGIGVRAARYYQEELSLQKAGQSIAVAIAAARGL
ncbi:MAG TPA: glycosyltransferase [Fimbriimonadaceae bacterium]|nr:glycosyltransferase [Fimbriimonadaceae bacterium]